MTRQQHPTAVTAAVMDRRQFLQRSAGLTLVIGASGLIGACSGDESPSMASAPEAANPLEANIWATINPDDSIKIMFAGTEMGQGSMTATPMVLAEHLDAAWDRVTVETVAVHDKAYGNPIFGHILYSGGSTNVMAYFDIMRKAGTQARKLLLNAAAEHWQVPVSELTTEPSVVVHQASGRRLRYGEIAAFASPPAKMPAVDASEFKHRSDYRYLGTDITRLDVPSKVDGSAEYGMDVQVPGMAYASVLKAPVEGETPLRIDDDAARKVRGVTDIVSLLHGVAVIGDSVEATRRGKQKLKVTWSNHSRFRKVDTASQLADYTARSRDLNVKGTVWYAQGDAVAAFSDAASVIEAQYQTDAAYHAQMEPLNATASVSADGKAAEIWVGTQTQSLSILGAAQALQTSPDKITLHPLLLGGGYGRRSEYRQKYIDDALFISRELKRPIKVIWSREDDVKEGTFRSTSSQYLRAAFDAQGQLSAWQHRVAVPSILEYMNPVRWKVAEEKGGGRDVISMLGAENSSRYAIPNFLAEQVMVERGSRVCAWRGVATSYTKFAAESFLDEVALAQGVDPMEYRLDLCRDNPRARTILEMVAEMADWSRPREGKALGLALTNYHKSLSAGVAEVSVDNHSGRIKVHKFWVAADPGLVVAPRNTEAQLEGNIVFGLSAALKERISIEGGEVQQSNFHDYHVMRITEVPDIEIKAISTDNPPSGVGELGLAMVAPAITNGIARLTGARVRQLPLTPERVLTAMQG
ncbi:MAG: molybdopterin cofactor-binding domain-containing protein [Gammaproteobacteria bacterium]